MASWRDAFVFPLNDVIDRCILSVDSAGGEDNITPDTWPWNFPYKPHSDTASIIIYKMAKLLDEYHSTLEKGVEKLFAENPELEDKIVRRSIELMFGKDIAERVMARESR